MELAAEKKCEEYKLLMKVEQYAKFVPLAFESWFFFAHDVDTFIETLMETRDHSPHAWDISKFDEMRVALAVAIQEGNEIRLYGVQRFT